MKNCSTLNMDGEVDGLVSMEAVTNGIQNTGGAYVEDLIGSEFYYNAGGLFSGYKKRRAEKQSRKRIREVSKAKAREDKARAKVIAAKGQSKVADSLSKGGNDDAVLAAALSAPPTEETKKSKLPLILGITAGVILLSVGGYFLVKHMKAKKGK